MTPEIALFLLGLTYVAEWALRVYHWLRPNAGPVFA